MKIAKSLLTLILCLAMTMTFTACKKSGDGQTSDEWEYYSVYEDVPGGKTENSSNNSSQQSDTGKNTINDNGGNVSSSNVANTNNKDFINSLKGLEITIWTQQQEKPTRGTLSGDKYYAVLDRVAKKYGVTINAHPSGISDESLQTSILAGKPQANVISIQDFSLASWLNAGTVAELDTAMEETGIDFTSEIYDQNVRKFTNLNGKQYAFHSDLVDVSLLIYNKRLVQEAGLMDPYELYLNGQWTLDKLTEYLKKLTKTSNDGTVLVRGMQSSAPAGLIGMLSPSIFTLENGNFVFNGSDLKVQKNLMYITQWYKNDQSVSSAANWREPYINFAQGKTAMVCSTKFAFNYMVENNMTDAVSCVPFPHTGTYTYQQIFSTIIPKCSQKDASKILFVMNEVYEELYKIREERFDNEFKSLIRDKNSYQLFKDYSLGNKKCDLTYTRLSGVMFDPYPQMQTLGNNLAGGMAVSTSVNSLSQSINASLKEQWGKWTFAK